MKCLSHVPFAIALVAAAGGAWGAVPPKDKPEEQADVPAILADAGRRIEDGDLAATRQLLQRVYSAGPLSESHLAALVDFCRTNRLYAWGAEAMKAQAAYRERGSQLRAHSLEAGFLSSAGQFAEALRVLEAMADSYGLREGATVDQWTKARNIDPQILALKRTWKPMEAVAIPEAVGLADTLRALRARTEGADAPGVTSAVLKLLREQEQHVAVAAEGLAIDALDCIRREIAQWPAAARAAVDAALEQEAARAFASLPKDDWRQLPALWRIYRETQAAAAGAERVADRLLDQGRAELALAWYETLRRGATAPALDRKIELARQVRPQPLRVSAFTNELPRVADVFPVFTMRSRPQYGGELLAAVLRPLAEEGTVFLNDGRHLRRSAAAGGAKAWVTVGGTDIKPDRDSNGAFVTVPHMPVPTFGVLRWETLAIARHAQSMTSARLLTACGLLAADAGTGAIRWRTRDNPELSGLHIASEPAVADGLVFAVARDAQDAGATVVALALDAKSGGVVWRRTLAMGQDSWPGPGIEMLAYECPPPLPTPNGVLFSTQMGQLCLLDSLSGEVRWMRAYARAPNDGMVTERPVMPASCAGGTLTVAPRDSVFAYSLDAATGRMLSEKPALPRLWKPDPGLHAGLTAPVVRRPPGGTPSGAGKVRATAGATGPLYPRLLWRLPMDLSDVDIPEDNRGVVLLSARNVLRLVNADGSGETIWEYCSPQGLWNFMWTEGTLVAKTVNALVGLDLASGRERWRMPCVAAGVAVCHARNGLFCAGLPGEDGFVCLSPADGSVKQRIPVPKGANAVAVREFRGHLYAEVHSGGKWDLRRLSQEGTLGELVYTYHPGLRRLVDIDPERVYTVSLGDKSFECWDIKTGRELWKIPQLMVDRRVVSAPGAPGSWWFLTMHYTQSPPIMMVDPATGRQVYAGPGSAAWNGSILNLETGAQSNTLSRLDYRQGRFAPSWQLTLAASPYCTATFPPGGGTLPFVYVNNGDDRDPLYRVPVFMDVDPSNGRLRSQTPLYPARESWQVDWRYGNSRMFVRTAGELNAFEVADAPADAAWFAARRQAAQQVADPGDRARALASVNLSEQGWRASERTWLAAAGSLELGKPWHWLPANDIEGHPPAPWRGPEDISCTVTAPNPTNGPLRLVFDVRDDVWTPMDGERGDAIAVDLGWIRVWIGMGATHLPVMTTEVRGYVYGEPGPVSAMRLKDGLLRCEIALPVAWRRLEGAGNPRGIECGLKLVVRDDDGAGVKGALTWGGLAGPSAIRWVNERKP